MHALVPPQVAQGTAGVAALRAAVGFLPGVGAQVALQVDQLGGCVGADGAAVRLLAVVDPHVALQVVGVARGEGAQRAGEQLGGDAVFTDGFLLPGGGMRGGGGGVLLLLLAAETVELRPQVQAHTWRRNSEGWLRGKSRAMHRGNQKGRLPRPSPAPRGVSPSSWPQPLQDSKAGKAAAVGAEGSSSSALRENTVTP